MSQGEFRVVQFTPPMPLALYAELCRGIDEACRRAGYEAFFKQDDGFGVAWVRPKSPDEWVPSGQETS